MEHGPRAGLDIIDWLADAAQLENYHLLHAARADMLRRLGFAAEATKSYRRALAPATNKSERRYLDGRLREVQAEKRGERASG